MKENRPEQQAGRKVVKILEELQKHERVGVTDVANSLDIAKSTAHYHLDTLVDEGYVVRDGSMYRLSLRFLRAGMLARDRISIYETGRTEVDKLAESTDELAILGVEEQGKGVYLHKSASENAVDIDAPIGRFAFLHNRAFGKAILAHLDESRVDAIINDYGLQQTSSRTITDRDELFDDLVEVRSRGYALNREESLAGIYGIGVPILGHGGSVHGAISLAGPSKQMESSVEEYAKLLERARNVVELTVQHQDFL